MSQIIKNAPYAAALLDERLCYVAASDQWIDDLGMGADPSGKSHLELFPLMGDYWRGIYQLGLKGKNSKNSDDYIMSIKGDLIQLKWEVQAVFDESEQVIGLLLYQEKLAERQESDSVMKRKVDLYEQTNQAARIGAWEFDFIQTELYWSPITKQIHGVDNSYQPDLHTAISFFKEGDNRNKIIQLFGTAFSSGASYQTDVILVNTQGQEVWVRANGRAEFANGICVRVYGTFQDIQEQKIQEIALANSEIKYRSIIENSLYAFLLTIPDTCVIDANQAAIDMFGYSLEEFKEIGRYDLLDKEDPRIAAFIETRAKTGKAIAELTCVRKNGEKFPCQLSSAIFTDSTGKKINSLVMIDITERHLSEKQNKIASNLVNEERKLLNTLIDHLPINVYIKDLEFRKIRVNRSEVAYMNGLTKEDIIGKTDYELYPSHTAAVSVKEDEEVLKSGIPMISKESVDHKIDGSVKYLLTSKIPLRNSEDEITGLLGISYDITKIKEAENALAVNEEKYRKIFENIQDIYYRTDKEGIVTEISPSVDKYYNYRRDEIIGHPVTDFYYHEEDREYIVNALRLDHEVTDFEVKLKTKSSQLVYASVNARLIIEDGLVLGSEGSIRDITSRKSQENELTELNTELKALNEHKEKLLSVIGHDLKNPIAASLKLAELALMDVDEATREELTEYLVKMETGLQNANELLENLLQWAKNQFNSINFNPVLIHDVRLLVVNCIKRIRPMADTKGIELVEKVPEGLKIYADKDMLDAIIRNLVSNAVKFTTAGQILVEVKIRDYDLLFSVKDTGVGMSENVMLQLFNKSFGHTTYGTSGEKGTGLGLELCRDFVEKHHGKIWVESKKDQGSTFYFTTPI